MKKFTERQLMAFNLRQDGETLKSIGIKMNITGSAARQLIVNYEIKARYNARYNTIISNFKNGKSIEWIAKNYDYSITKVIDVLKKEKLI